MNLIDKISNLNHESLVVKSDSKNGFISIIAIHSTKLGPSLGGCRFKSYSSLDYALSDVLNLSSAMTYKNALAGIGFGGGKSVIIPTFPAYTQDQRDALFCSFSTHVNGVNGSYITAEDMGTTESDMRALYAKSQWVCGKPSDLGGGGDPSPFTALGVFYGIKACLKEVFGTDNITGKTIGIEGFGSVGYYLGKHIVGGGGEIVVSDTSSNRLEIAKNEFNAKIVDISDMYGQELDVFAPCAIGGTVNIDSLSQLKAPIIAGGANNQLASQELGSQILEKGIIYAPDFAINAGGVISCADEFSDGGYNKDRVEDKSKAIFSTISEIINHSKAENLPTSEVAISLAQDILSK